MKNRNKKVVGFEEIAHIFLSMEKEEKDDFDNSKIEYQDFTSKLRVIPILASIEQEKKSFFLKNISIELVKQNYISYLYNPSNFLLDVYGEDLRYQKKGSKNSFDFLHGILKESSSNKVVFYDLDYDLSKIYDALFLANREIFVIVSALDKEKSKQYLDCIMDLITKNKELVVWMAISDCNPHIKLDNFFAEFNKHISKNLFYCGIIPPSIPGYQSFFGNKLMRLSDKESLYEKEIFNKIKTIVYKSFCVWKVFG